MKPMFFHNLQHSGKQQKKQLLELEEIISRLQKSAYLADYLTFLYFKFALLV